MKHHYIQRLMFFGRFLILMILVLQLTACADNGRQETKGQESVNQETLNQETLNQETAIASAENQDAAAEEETLEIAEAIGMVLSEQQESIIAEHSDKIRLFTGSKDVVYAVESRSEQFSVFGFVPGAYMHEYAKYLEENGWLYRGALLWIRSADTENAQNMESLTFELGEQQLVFTFAGVCDSQTAESVIGISVTGAEQEFPEDAHYRSRLSAFSWMVDRDVIEEAAK